MNASGQRTALDTVLNQLKRVSSGFSSSIFEPVELILLQQTIKEINQRQNINTEPELPPKKQESLSARWQTLKQTSQWQQLTRRDIRDLLSIPDVFIDPDLLPLINQQRPLNKRLLTVVLRSYVSFWQLLSEKDRQNLASVIQEALESPELARLSWPAFRHWKIISPWLLGTTPEPELAKLLSSHRGTLADSVREALQLEASCANESLVELARQHVLKDILRLDREGLEEQLEQALSHWVKPLSDYGWLSALIIRVHQLGDEALIELVKSWFLKAEGFGDLRLNPNGGWGHISIDAKQMFSNWLSKEDLEFFFKMVLPEREDPHRRREFWEQYLPCVIRSRVLLSDEDARRNSPALQKMKSEGKTMPGSIKNSSVFIMETKQCYILEFSEKKNAAYIYWKNTDPLTLTIRSKLEQILQFKFLQNLSTSTLKLGHIIPLLTSSNKKNLSIRCIHDKYGRWHQLLKEWLYLHGIRP